MCLASGQPGGHEMAMMIDLGGTSVRHREVARQQEKVVLTITSCMSGSTWPKRAELDLALDGWVPFLQFESRGPNLGLRLGKREGNNAA